MFRQVIICCLMFAFLNVPAVTFADKKPHKNEKEHFHARVTDVEGVLTELDRVKLYWEEKIDATSFVLHEENHIDVKRGKAIVKIGLKNIQTIEVLPKQNGHNLNVLRITLHNGNQGEFPLARDVSLVGHSDFGKMQIPLRDLAKVELD